MGTVKSRVNKKGQQNIFIFFLTGIGAITVTFLQ